MRKLSRVTMILALTVLLGLSAFSTVAQAQDDEPIAIRMSALTFVSHLPLRIGIEAGYFEEEGLEVELVEIRRSAEAVAALTQGDLDVAGVALNPGLLNTIARGSEFKIVADKGTVAAEGTCSYVNLLVRTELIDDGTVASLEDIAGLTVDAPFVNPNGYLLDLALQEIGLSIEDITVNDLPSNVGIESLQQAALDATVTSDPWTTRIADSEAGVNFIAVDEASGLEDFPFSYVVFGPTMLNAEDDRGERFMRAYLRAVAQYNEGATEDNLDMYEVITGLDRDLLERLCYPFMAADGLLDPQSIIDYQEWAIGRELVDEVVEVEDFWDPSFVEAAAASMDMEMDEAE